MILAVETDLIRTHLFLAFNVFGAAGKLAIEVSMIGFLGGTCIAFFVVMGDLAPPIIAGYLGIENSERLRIGVMLGKYHSEIRFIIEHTKIKLIPT